MKNLNSIFSRNMKYIREKQGISQEKLAELSGLHRTYISAIECEKRNISLANVHKIALALDVEAYILLKENIYG